MALEVRDLAAFTKALVSHPQVVVHFWAAWCEPCKFLDTVLQQLAADAPSVTVVRVEAEEAADVSEQQGISVVPTFQFFRGGKQVDSLEGADAATLTAKFTALASSSSSAGGGGGGAAQGNDAAGARIVEQPLVSGQQDLQARLGALVKQQPVMLFMKGSPEAPRCGFSRKVVEALRATGQPFGSFDILSDDDVRQGLKEYSSWPTYPQLYVNGELLGGCDIVLEMAQTGELAEALAPAVAAASAGGGSGRSAEEERKEKLRQRLHQLVNQEPVMLFMKGTPEAPQCGFSLAVVEALQAAGQPFGSFDILRDDEVRQGLKEYSSWPTYPQLYVNGELLGGCDIVLVMAQTGELQGTIAEMKAIN